MRICSPELEVRIQVVACSSLKKYFAETSKGSHYTTANIKKNDFLKHSAHSALYCINPDVPTCLKYFNLYFTARLQWKI